MKTGDTVRDPQGRAFQLGQQLGRGLWARSFAAREDGGGDWVVKVPLGASELSEGGERLAQACNEIALEQASLLQQGAGQGLVALELAFKTADGTPVLVLARYPSSLDRRYAAGCSFDEAVRTAVEVGRALRALAPVLPAHGLLKPSNVLFTDKGEVRLADPATPTLRRNLSALLRASPAGAHWLAPEVRAGGDSPPMSTAADSYAVAMMVYRAILVDPGSSATPALPDAGLDKAALVSLKDRVHARLKAEPSNPRFHARLSERVSALLNRALSKEPTPSPPFRFARLDELVTRLEEVQSLIHPSVSHVGKLLLDRPPGSDSFNTDESIAFSCTIATTPGVENHEEIAAGIALFDQERDERLRQVSCSYTVDRHPSGRFRFGFKVTDLGPGAYRVRVAFAIRDSGHEPITAEGRFVVRAAPGYVPPRAEPEPRPLMLERPELTAITERRPAPVPVAPPEADETSAETPRPEPDPPRATPEPRYARPAPVVQLHPAPRTAARREPVLADDEDSDDRRSSPTSPEDDIDDEPEYRGAGRWTDLPVPGMAPARRDSDDDDDDEDSDDHERPSGTDAGRPFAEPIARLVQLVRGETYWLYVAGAVGFILLLLITLLALR